MHPLQQEVKDFLSTGDLAEQCKKIGIAKSTAERVAVKGTRKPDAEMLCAYLDYIGEVKKELMAKVRVCFPVYKSVDPATNWCLVQMAKDFGSKLEMDQEAGHAMIYHARDILADRFMKSKMEWSFWIDDDMVIPTGRPGWFKKTCRMPESYPTHLASIYALERLTSLGQTIVAGVYYGKKAEGKAIFAESLYKDADPIARDLKNPQILESDWAGTGCMAIHRSVFEDVAKGCPDIAPGAVNDYTYNGKKHRIRNDFPYHQFFNPIPGQGEDVAFFTRAKACGHQVYVDTAVQAGHVGRCVYAAHNTNGKG